MTEDKAKLFDKLIRALNWAAKCFRWELEAERQSGAIDLGVVYKRTDEAVQNIIELRDRYRAH